MWSADGLSMLAAAVSTAFPKSAWREGQLKVALVVIAGGPGVAGDSGGVADEIGWNMCEDEIRSASVSRPRFSRQPACINLGPRSASPDAPHVIRDLHRPSGRPLASSAAAPPVSHLMRDLQPGPGNPARGGGPVLGRRGPRTAVSFLARTRARLKGWGQATPSSFT